MTEDEAKKKWCPFSRVALDWGEPDDGRGGVNYHRFAVGFNRDALGDYYEPKDDHNSTANAATWCLGSACMAWRWKDDQPDHGPKDHGHCGLAGRP